MPFNHSDHVVQAFAPHAADQAFRIRILPRASWRRVPRKGFANLLCQPIRGRMCGDAEMLDAPPLMTQLERSGRLPASLTGYLFEHFAYDHPEPLFDLCQKVCPRNK